MIQILHNPNCSKSNCALDFLKEKEISFEVIDYINHSLSVDELRNLIRKLGIPAKDLVRQSERIYKEQFSGRAYSEEEWIEIMAKYPILIERPIIIKGNQAVIGRPMGKVVALLGEEPQTKGK